MNVGMGSMMTGAKSEANGNVGDAVMAFVALASDPKAAMDRVAELRAAEASHATVKVEADRARQDAESALAELARQRDEHNARVDREHEDIRERNRLLTDRENRVRADERRVAEDRARINLDSAAIAAAMARAKLLLPALQDFIAAK